jgi:hypothetical protein
MGIGVWDGMGWVYGGKREGGGFGVREMESWECFLSLYGRSGWMDGWLAANWVKDGVWFWSVC